VVGGQADAVVGLQHDGTAVDHPAILTGSGPALSGRPDHFRAFPPLPPRPARFQAGPTTSCALSGRPDHDRAEKVVTPA
jgi:hypothetical protein